MNSLQAIWLVARREIRERGKSKGYIISTFLTIILVGGAIALPALLEGGPDTNEVAVVGEGGEELVTTADDISVQEAGEQDPDRYESRTFDDLAAAEAALEEGEVEAVVVDGEELVIGRSGAFGGSGIERLLQQAAATQRVQQLTAENQGAAEILEILSSQPLETRRLGDVDEDEEALRGMVAFGGLILMYIAILSYGSWMLSGVTEEKTNRVVEVLLSSLRPWHILGGKLIGIGMLGLGQLVVLVTVGLVGIRLSGAVDIPAVPVDSAIALVGWFILGFLLYAIIYGAAGSLVSRMEDAQNAAAPLTIVALVGYLFSFAALNDPEGTVAIVGTYIPFTAPYVAPIRLAIGDIAVWEMALAVVITVITIGLLVRLAGRVYAGGLLRFGGRVKWTEAFRSAE